MQLNFNHSGMRYTADLEAAIDISQGFGPEGDNPQAFHIGPAQLEPFRIGTFVGSVAQGSGANCEVIQFCAHGNCTHTECMGHITPERLSVNKLIKNGYYTTCLATVEPEEMSGDFVITSDVLAQAYLLQTDTLVVRTTKDFPLKGHNWSGSNPPYFTAEAMQFLISRGYKHILTDLPSVDREEDGGALSAHHAWWNYPAEPRLECSITELVVVPGTVPDGLYLLGLFFAPIESDAAPSRPVLYPVKAD
jgi:kynurenine formamidase